MIERIRFQPAAAFRSPPCRNKDPSAEPALIMTVRHYIRYLHSQQYFSDLASGYRPIADSFPGLDAGSHRTAGEPRHQLWPSDQGRQTLR
jgi:hypothetical protein